MPEADLVELVRHALVTGMVAVAPALLAGFIVAVVMGIVQGATGIHEQLVGLAPRLVAMAAAVFLALPWMLERLVDLVRSSAGGP